MTDLPEFVRARVSEVLPNRMAQTQRRMYASCISVANLHDATEQELKRHKAKAFRAFTPLIQEAAHVRAVAALEGKLAMCRTTLAHMAATWREHPDYDPSWMEDTIIPQDTGIRRKDE